MERYAIIRGTVEYFPYRTARPTKRFLELPRGEGTKILEESLARAAGVHPDNHVVYGLSSDDGDTLYIMFHDWNVIFGFGVEVQDW